MAVESSVEMTTDAVAPSRLPCSMATVTVTEPADSVVLYSICSKPITTSVGR